MSNKRNHQIAKKIGEILDDGTGPIIPTSKEGQIKRNYEDIHYVENDLNKLQNCLAIFYFKENRFFKITDIDYRGLRYQVSGEKITRWFSFNQEVELFIFTTKETFYKFYELYKAERIRTNERIKAPEKIFSWLAQDFSRLTAKIMDNDD